MTGMSEAATIENPAAHLGERLDQLEQTMLDSGAAIPLPLSHTFTKGLYMRQIFMPRGSLVTSKIHRTQHPFAVMMGECSVLIPGKGVERIVAPYIGITEPGTRRVLYMHEDTLWVTFHPNPDDETDLEVIEQRLIVPNTLAGGTTAFERYSELLEVVPLAATPPAQTLEGGTV
jgi:hypothetical protein